MTCVRRAWLSLNGRTVELEGRGYGCTSLDLGAPEVRDVTNNRPDADGIDDRTRYMGGRAVTATIAAVAGGGARIDEVASSFGPFMVPSARPELHYVLDRGTNPERVLVVRASAYQWPIEGPDQREIALSWIAPDPIARDPVGRQAVAMAGSAVAFGRAYPWRPPRTYPAGSQGPTVGVIESDGDVPVRPYLRIFGPCDNPVVSFNATNPAGSFVVALDEYRIDAGQFVGIDTDNHVAYLNDDPTQSVLSAVDWASVVWPVLPVAPGSTEMSLVADNTNYLTQVVASWRDGYLT